MGPIRAASRRLVGAALALVGLGGACLAEGKLEPPDLSRYVRWGPLRARPGLELSNIGHDDNIFFNDSLKVSDYTATLTPKLDGLVLFGSRAFLVFSERLGYTAYVRNSDQNYLDQRGSARLTVPFGNIGLFTDVALNDVKERPLDRQDIRPERTERRLGVGLIVKPGWRTEIELGRSGAGWSYDDPDADPSGPSIGDRLDRSTRTTTLGVDYRLTGRTKLTLDAHSRRIDFDRLQSSGGELIDQDSHEQSLQPGLIFGEGGSLTGSIRAGWAEIDARDARLPDLSEIVGKVELAYRPNSRWILRLDGERTPGFSIFRENTYFLNTAAGLRAVYYWSRIFGVETGGARGRLTFPESASGATRRDRVERFDVGVRMRLAENSLGRRIEYSLKIGRYDRSSSEPGFDISQGTFGINAIVGF